MEFIKKKDGTYLLVELDKVDTEYLKDFRKIGDGVNFVTFFHEFYEFCNNKIY